MWKRALPIAVFGAVALLAACNSNKKTIATTPGGGQPKAKAVGVAKVSPDEKQVPPDEHQEGDQVIPAPDAPITGAGEGEGDVDPRAGIVTTDASTASTVRGSSLDVGNFMQTFFAERARKAANAPLTGGQTPGGLLFSDLKADGLMKTEVSKVQDPVEAQALARTWLAAGLGYSTEMKMWMVSIGLRKPDGSGVAAQMEARPLPDGRMVFESDPGMLQQGVDLRGTIECKDSRTSCNVAVISLEKKEGALNLKASAVLRRYMFDAYDAKFVVRGSVPSSNPDAPEMMADPAFRQVAQFVRDGIYQKDPEGYWQKSYRLPRLGRIDVESFAIAGAHSQIGLAMRFDYATQDNGQRQVHNEWARFRSALARRDINDNAPNVMMEAVSNPFDEVAANVRNNFNLRLLKVNDDGTVSIELVPRGSSFGSESILLQVKAK